MNIRPIRGDEDHTAALRRIDALWGAAEGTPEGDELDVLVALVSHYEESRWPAPRLGRPADFLRGYLSLTGRTQADVAALLGSKSRASEILNGKRECTLDQIRRLRHAWGIPADCMIGEDEIA
jgi:HTH-type transcriptional regulator/antitoxin HigA